MRYSTIFKFVAFVLCAAALLGMVSSAAGIFFLTELGGKSVDEYYTDQLQSQALGYGLHAAEICASEELGGAPGDFLNYHYGNDWESWFFDWQSVGYTLYDGQGNILREKELPDSSRGIGYEFTNLVVGGRYMKVIAVTPREEHAPQPSEPPQMEARVLVMPAQETTAIGEVYVDYPEGRREAWPADGTQLGTLCLNGGNTVTFVSNIGEFPVGDGWYPNHVLMLDMGGNVVYEVAGDGNVVLGSELDDDYGCRIHLPAGTVTTVAPTGQTYTDGDYTSYDAIPAQGATVTSMNISYANAQGEMVGSEGVASPDLIGTVFHNVDGNAEFRSNSPMTMDIPDGCILTGIAFIDAQQNMLYEASCPGGVGTLEYDQDGYMIFRGRMPGTGFPEEIPPETVVVEAPEEPADRIGFAREKLNIYSAPSPQAQIEGTVEAWEEIAVSTQKTFDGVRWGRIPGGWILMEKVLLEEADTESHTVPRTADTPAEIPAATEETIPESTEVTAAPAENPEEGPVPVETDSEAETIAVAEETLPAEAVHSYPAEDTETGIYYDNAQKQHMVAEYVWDTIPDGYTITVRLAPGALRNELGWTLLRLAEAFESLLLEALGICTAVFVLCVIHLCCSAGRTRRMTEVRAGGLNRIPLDLYLACGGFAVVGLAAAAMCGSQYLARNDEQVAMIFCGVCCYALCAVMVAFGFAFVAQIKTPGNFWWHNSVCGRCIKLAGSLFRGAGRMGTRVVPQGAKVLRWLWKTFLRALNACRKLILWAWDTGKHLLIQLWQQICRGVLWILGRVLRFYNLLPLTWQWLLTGFFMTMGLYICLRSYKVGWLLLGFGVFFGIILYGAHIFGNLLESAKRMAGGDLESKVDDRFMVGAFREFAAELNELADVAVVAAQKQMKSERMKTELITNVSHDIKTPLTSIINYVDLMEKPHTPEEQAAYLEVLSRQSQRLKKLIDDLMEMSKASTGNMSVDIQRVNAAEAVNQALGEFGDKLERAQLTPVFRHPEKEVEMLADGRLVWRVMSNLLGNAVKYAMPGTRMYLDLMEMDGKVIISIKNISREALNVSADELLERFVRGDAARNTEGSGLGLNIAQSLMELQKGQLQLLVDGDLFKVTLIFPGA